MQNGIELFTKTGALRPLSEIEPQLTDDSMRERFAAVRSAYEASAQADADVLACQDSIKDAMAEVADAERDMKERFPPRTFLDEWRQAKATRAAE